MDQVAQDFEKAWQHFETGFKGKLLARSNKQPMVLSLANVVLKEASSDWFSGYGLEGQWLKGIKSSHPDKGTAIEAILKQKLRFADGAQANPQPAPAPQAPPSNAPSTPPRILNPIGAPITQQLGRLLMSS
jgi:hypothetical protein